MAVRHRDVKDVSRLVTKKLEMYMNLERRENRFDPTGPFRTTPKMHKFDFMYKVLDKVVLDKLPSARKSDVTSNSTAVTQSTTRQTSDRKRHTFDGSKFEEDSSSNTKSTKENEDSATKETAYRIKPQLEQTSRSVVLHREAERLTNYANKVFEEIPLQKLQLIHRHRPAYSHKIPDKPEFGKCQGYSRHVGAVLHSDKFVDYYVKEGLHVGMSKRKDFKESQKFCCNTASPREKMQRSKTDIAKPRQSGYELGLYRTKTRMSRKLSSHNKSPPSKRSLDSTTTLGFSSSVRSDHVPSRPLPPIQKRYNSSKDMREINKIDISLPNNLNGYEKNVAELDTHSVNGKIKPRKCVLQENERTYHQLVENKNDQEKMMTRDYNEHSILNINANTEPKLSSILLESSTTTNILTEDMHSNFRQITVSEAPKDDRTSTPISPKKEEDYIADKTGNVRTVFYDNETMKLDVVSITEVENNVTNEGTTQEGSEHEGEISNKKDANQNVQETTSSPHGNTQKTDEAQEIIKPQNNLYADMPQRNAAFIDKRLIRNDKSDTVASTKVDTTGEEQSDTKSEFESAISVTSNTEEEKTPIVNYEDKRWNSFDDAKEQQQENTSFEENVMRDDAIKEAKQEKDEMIEKNNGNDDDKSTEEEFNDQKHSQNMSEKLTDDDNYEVNVLGAEDIIPSEHCANETSNWSRSLKQETSFSDNERNETVTEQHISSGLSEDSLSRLATQKRYSLTLSDNDVDRTDSAVIEVNNKPSSETEQVQVLTAIPSSVVDLSENEYSDTSSSEDGTSEGNVSDVNEGHIENIENTRSGMPDENTPVEDPCTKNAEKVLSTQPENKHVKPDVDIPGAIIHDPKTLDDVTNGRDATVVTEYNTNADSSVQLKHTIPEKYEKEQPLEQKSELEPHTVKDSETRNKSNETEEQTTEMEIPKETRTDAAVGVLQQAKEESNVMHVTNLEIQEWQEERSEEFVEEIAEERSLELENGTVSDKDALLNEIHVIGNLQDETDEPLRKEEETIELNLESELTVRTYAETDIEVKAHSIKDSEPRKIPETEYQTTKTESPKKTGTVVTGELLTDSEEQSNIINTNNLEIQEWQEEKSEEFVEVIAEEHSLELENGNVSDKDTIYSEPQATVNLHYETDEPLTKAQETIALNQELMLTMSTHAETDAETKPMDSTNISDIGTHRRNDTSESTVPDPDINEGQYDNSKEIKEPSILEKHERTTVKENGQHIETQTVLDEENILATKIFEDSPNVSESETESISDNEIPGCRQNDTESYTKPESLKFDYTISMSTDDSKAEKIEHSTTQAEQLNLPDNGERN